MHLPACSSTGAKQNICSLFSTGWPWISSWIFRSFQSHAMAFAFTCIQLTSICLSIFTAYKINYCSLDWAIISIRVYTQHTYNIEKRFSFAFVIGILAWRAEIVYIIHAHAHGDTFVAFCEQSQALSIRLCRCQQWYFPQNYAFCLILIRSFWCLLLCTNTIL